MLRRQLVLVGGVLVIGLLVVWMGWQYTVPASTTNMPPVVTAYLNQLTGQAKHVSLCDGGEWKNLWLTGQTVGQGLAAAGIRLSENDWVEPNLDARLRSGQEITIHRIEILQQVRYEPLAFSEVRKPNALVSQGTQRVVQEGHQGQKTSVYAISYTDGMETGRVLVREGVSIAPVDRIIEYGTMDQVSRGGKTYGYTTSFYMRATAYTAGFESTGKNPGDPEYGITFSGLPVQKGHIAVDPNVIPLLSYVYVEGLDSYSSQYDGVYYCTDTGSAIKGNRIDIYVDTEPEADLFGVRRVRVYQMPTGWKPGQ